MEDESVISYLKNKPGRLSEEEIHKLASEEISVELLRSKLDDPQDSLRARLAQVLGELNYDAVLNDLERLLKDQDDWWVREEAATALGKKRSKHAMQLLINALTDEENSGVRLRILEALLELDLHGEDTITDVVATALTDLLIDSRIAAIAILAKIRSDRTIPYLLAAAQEEHYDVRIRAILALVTYGSDALPHFYNVISETFDQGVLKNLFTGVKFLLRRNPSLIPSLTSLNLDEMNIKYEIIRMIPYLDKVDAVPYLKRLRDQIEDKEIIDAINTTLDLLDT